MKDRFVTKLIEASREARDKAYAPYSDFRVGAAVLGKTNSIYTGCTVENASYGLTVCAERVAVWKAVSEGERGFSSLCVVADTVELTPPCGSCRQIIWHFCGDIPVILANLSNYHEVLQMRSLLPRPYSSARFSNLLR